jgi:hypothetical protein
MQVRCALQPPPREITFLALFSSSCVCARERVKRRREGENTEAAGRCTYYQHYYFHATCDVRARGAAFVEIVTRGDARAHLPALHTCRPASQLATLSLCRPDRPPVPCTRVLRPHTSRPASYPERLRRRLEHLEHRVACAAPCTPLKKKK